MLALVTLALCGLPGAARAKSLDQMVAGFAGAAALELEEVGAASGGIQGSIFFHQGQWFLGDLEGLLYGGEYSRLGRSKKRFALGLAPETAAALQALIEAELAAMIFNQYGLVTSVAIDVTERRVEVQARSGFRKLKLKLRIDFVADGPDFLEPVEGAFKISAQGPLANAGGGSGRKVVVNGKKLGAKSLKRLERRFGIRVVNGRYWYDSRSGLWGERGGPALGQIPPRLELGGSLSRKASRGQTGVLVNGREITRVELRFVESVCGRVESGSYWLEPDGRAGREGSGRTLCSLASGGSGGGGSILGHSLSGSVIGGDGIVGFIDGGTGVTCGPDGGCVY
jgi:hypothetical protein